MKKLKKRDKMLAIAVICILGYTVTAFILQFHTSVEISSTLTLSWFGFWTVEIWQLSRITTTKLNNRYYSQAGMPAEESEDESC